MNLELVLSCLTDYKEPIALITTVLTGIIFLIKQIGLYLKASSYSTFFKLPIELFNNENKMKGIENIMLAFIPMFYVPTPFILSSIVSDKYRPFAFVLSFTALYWLIIIVVVEKHGLLKNLFKGERHHWPFNTKPYYGLINSKVYHVVFNDKTKRMLVMDLLLSIILTFILGHVFNYDPTHLTIVYTISLILFFIAFVLMIVENNPSLENQTEFLIIDQDEIEELEIKIESDSVLLVVDYLRDNRMLVKECVEKEDCLILKSKFWTISGEGVGISTKEFPKGIDRN